MTGTDPLHDIVGIAYQARFEYDIDITNESTTANIVTEKLVDFKRNLYVTPASSQVTTKTKPRRT